MAFTDMMNYELVDGYLTLLFRKLLGRGYGFADAEQGGEIGGCGLQAIQQGLGFRRAGGGCGHGLGLACRSAR